VKHAIAAIMLLTIATAAEAGVVVDKTLDVKPDGIVRIENVRGRIDVQGWNRDQVQVVGTLDDSARSLTFETAGAATTVRVEMPEHFGHGDGSNLVIHVPEKSRVQVDVVSAELHLTDLQGDVDAKTVSGGIEATDVAGRVELATVSGKIHVDRGNGPMTFSSVSGNIRADVATNRLRISTVSGTADVTSSTAVDELTMHSVSGDLKIGTKVADGARIEGSTTSGDIRLAINRDAGAVVEMHASAGGGIRNTLTKDPPNRNIAGAETLDLTLGNGRASIELTTVSGDLELAPL
jgi:DUF4097 and DUF4098 domain-containing protein YvlB